MVPLDTAIYYPSLPTNFLADFQLKICQVSVCAKADTHAHSIDFHMPYVIKI